MPYGYTKSNRNNKLLPREAATSNASSGNPLACENVIDLYKAAMVAIEHENHQELTTILGHESFAKQGKNVISNLLFVACKADSEIAIVRTILDHGANVNQLNMDEQSAVTCLMVAAKNGNQQLVELLVDFGAKIDATDQFGWTALFYASYFGQEGCTWYLVEQKASVNVADFDGMNCLMWAAGRGQLGLVNSLIEGGANVNAVDKYNTSPLVWASRKGDTDIVELLLKSGANIDEQGMYGWTPLVVATYGNFEDTVRLLLDHKPNLSLCDGDRMSALMVACMEGFDEIAIELINRGAPTGQLDNQNRTPLILAAKARRPAIVKALVESGAYVDHLDQDNRSAIHWSIIVNDVESYKTFLAIGIDTNAKNCAGETHLMLAAKHRHEDIIKSILESHTIAAKRRREAQRHQHSHQPTNQLLAVESCEKLFRSISQARSSDNKFETMLLDTN